MDCEGEAHKMEEVEETPASTVSNVAETRWQPRLKGWCEEPEDEDAEGNPIDKAEQSICEFGNTDNFSGAYTKSGREPVRSMEDFEQSCVDEFEKTCELVQRLSREQSGRGREPRSFDPLVPEASPVFNPATTDWAVALQHVFS